jgi:hypothetical protein
MRTDRCRRHRPCREALRSPSELSPSADHAPAPRRCNRTPEGRARGTANRWAAMTAAERSVFIGKAARARWARKTTEERHWSGVTLVQARQNRVPMIPAPTAGYVITSEGKVVPLDASPASSGACQVCGDTSAGAYRPHPLRENVAVFRCSRHATAPAAGYRCHVSAHLLVGATVRRRRP